MLERALIGVFCLFVCLQAAKATTGGLIAAIGANAKTVGSATPSRAPASALMATRGGVARSRANAATTASCASYPASVSTAPPATTRRGSASVRRATRGLCECARVCSFATLSSVSVCLSARL